MQLIAQKERSQEVKKVVDYLNLKNTYRQKPFRRSQTMGWSEFALGTNFKQRICVKPLLWPQSHSHLTTLMVVEGIAKVKVDDDIKLLSEGQSVYVFGCDTSSGKSEKSPMVR